MSLRIVAGPGERKVACRWPQNERWRRSWGLIVLGMAVITAEVAGSKSVVVSCAVLIFTVDAIGRGALTAQGDVGLSFSG